MEDEPAGFVAHLYEAPTQRENASAIDLALTDDPDDATKTRVRITGVPDDPGVLSLLFRVLADNSIYINKIVSETSETGTMEISFTVSKASRPAFVFAYGEFHQEILGPGGSR